MFLTYDQNRTLIADRHRRFEAAAERRRFLTRSRRRSDEATMSHSLDRATTPVEAEHRAA